MNFLVYTMMFLLAFMKFPPKSVLAQDSFTNHLSQQRIYLKENWSGNWPLLTPYTINEIVVEESSSLQEFWNSLYLEEQEKMKMNVHRLHIMTLHVSPEDVRIILGLDNLEYLYLQYLQYGELQSPDIAHLKLRDLARTLRKKNYDCLINLYEHWTLCEKFPTKIP